MTDQSAEIAQAQEPPDYATMARALHDAAEAYSRGGWVVAQRMGRQEAMGLDGVAQWLHARAERMTSPPEQVKGSVE